MPKLRDGSQTNDVRLDRIIHFDERSRGFAVRPMVEQKEPRSYTWRCRTYLDQGQEGACVGFGISHELAARPAEVVGVTNQFAREKIYWEAQKIDEWEGGAYPGAEPVYEGTSVLAGVKVAQQMGFFDAYYWAFGLNDVILGVGYGGPAVLGLPWLEGMFNVDSQGYIHATGAVAGGHCLLCRGVDVSENFFLLRNSWGKTWGVNGDCKISFDDFQKVLKDGGEAVFFKGRHNVPI